MQLKMSFRMRCWCMPSRFHIPQCGPHLFSSLLNCTEGAKVRRRVGHSWRIQWILIRALLRGRVFLVTDPLILKMERKVVACLEER